jgi:iron uptake system EfeUOB component EfeO/EfeM
VYLASLNQAVAFYREGTLSANEQEKINTGTLIKYILAFMITMIDDYYENYATYNTAATTPTYNSMSLAYAAFLNGNPKLAAGTLVATDTLDTGVMDDILGGMEAYITSDGMQDRLTKLVARTKVLVEISGFVNEDLDELLDDLPTTIEEWFADDTDVE